MNYKWLSWTALILSIGSFVISMLRVIGKI